MNIPSPPASRINVVGTSGSGKSTFAKKLAAALGLPYVEIDSVYWKARWEQPADEEFFPKLSEALQCDAWVLDGNYTRTIPIKWAKVEWVIWLDLSFATTLRQAIRRAIRRIVTREELWVGTGNRETFRKTFFSKNSILWWTVTTHAKNRARLEDTLLDPRYQNIRFFRLRTRAEADHFLRDLSAKL